MSLSTVFSKNIGSTIPFQQTVQTLFNVSVYIFFHPHFIVLRVCKSIKHKPGFIPEEAIVDPCFVTGIIWEKLLTKLYPFGTI